MSAAHLHTWAPALASTLPRDRLGTGPTPVRPLDGLPGVWVKDEGAYGDGAWGGNKVRKLEWTLADARRRGRATVLTFGALGSNHALATARYAPAAGLHAAVALVEQPRDEHVLANLARLRASGASVHVTGTTARTVAAMPWLLARHRRPYVLPAGGSSPVGVLGYVEASLELAAQVRDGVLPAPGTIVCAVGSGGTLAGLLLGLRIAGLGHVAVEGVVVSDVLPLDARRTVRLSARTARLLRDRGAPVPAFAVPGADRVRLVRDALGPGYGHATAEAQAARERARAQWGLDLDLVYTAKAFGRLLRAREQDAYGPGPVLFLDTGGPRP